MGGPSFKSVFLFFSAMEKEGKVGSRCGRESVLGWWFEDCGGCIPFFNTVGEGGGEGGGEGYFVVVGPEANKVTRVGPREV